MQSISAKVCKFLIPLLALLITACGGGGGSTDVATCVSSVPGFCEKLKPAPSNSISTCVSGIKGFCDSLGSGLTSSTSAEGAYGGTLTGSLSNAVRLLILENGDFYGIYGTETSTQFRVAGLVQGRGASNNGTYVSSDIKDFGVIPAASGVVTATYDSINNTITGTGTSGSLTYGFSGGPIAGSTYDYDKAASLTTISGSWSTSSLSGEGVSLTVAPNGSFTAISRLGCNFSGNVVPRASGKNVFDATVTFGPSPCILSGQSASGIAVTYPLTNGTTQLVVAAVDSTRTYGSILYGAR